MPTVEPGAIPRTAAAVGSLRLQAVGELGRDVQGRLDRIALGARVDALLATKLSDGSFQVELARARLPDGSLDTSFEGASVRMQMPAGAQTGQRLELTMVAREPRPTFLLQAGAGSQAGVQASLSSAARLVDNLLSPSANPAAPGSQTVLQASLPLQSAVSTDAPGLAASLTQALDQSGLFYESHVAQWAEGKRTLAQLRAEPQFGYTAADLRGTGPAGQPGQPPAAGGSASAFASAPATPGGSGNTASTLPGLASNFNQPTAASSPAGAQPRQFSQQAGQAGQAGNGGQPEGAGSGQASVVPAANRLLLEALRALPDDGASAPTSVSDTAGPDTTAGTVIDADSEAARMIRQQLDTLEHHQLFWRGEAWPGLPMEWAVAEDGAGKAGAAERSWHSVLRMHFQHLGTVTASIRLSGQQMQLSLAAPTPVVAQRLRQEAAALATAMDAAGTPLHLLTVREENGA